MTVFLRILIVYSLLILTMRLTGKRQIGEMQVSELVTTILLSELAAMPIADDRVPLTFALIPIAVLISLEVIISFAVTRIPLLKPIFDGHPSVLIHSGKIDMTELSKVRISLEELLSEIRIAGVGDIADVDYAILEHNGKLSVIPKRASSPPSSDELKLKPTEHGIAHAVVVDSKISEHELSIIKKDREWLDSRLRQRKTPIERVLLFTVDDVGHENVVLRR